MNPSRRRRGCGAGGSPPELPLRRWRMFHMQGFGPGRAVHQLAAAVGAAVIERFGAIGAKSALEAADERAGRLGRQVRPATLAIGAHLEHQAAAFSTAAQIEATAASTSAASSPSAMTRITGSVPEG